MSIRIAILGAGIMGRDHARIIAEDVPGVVLQVVCDASESRARSVADSCGAIDVSTDPLAVIARVDVDAILIATPDDSHAGLTLAAIAARKPVLCEKPLAPSIDDCLKVMAEEVRLNHRFVQLGFMRRFDPSYTEMKSAVTSGLLGRPLMMHNFHRNVVAPAGFTGQMAVTNSAPHEFDIARFVLGADYAAISVFQPISGKPSATGTPVFIVLETISGQLVNVEIHNNATYGYDVRGELVGETGSIFLSAPVDARINSNFRAFERYPADWRPRFAEAYRKQNRAWLKSIQTGIPSTIAANAWDGYWATLTAQAGITALIEACKIKIGSVERPALYR